MLFIQVQKISVIRYLFQALGNHEFDDGIDGVTPYMQMLRAPIVLSNVNDTLEPTFQGLYRKSVVVERNGKKIGIIGVIIHTCNVSRQSCVD